MAKKEKPIPEKDYEDPTVDKNGVITYNIQPHDVEIVVKWEFNVGPPKPTNE